MRNSVVDRGGQHRAAGHAPHPVDRAQLRLRASSGVSVVMLFIADRSGVSPVTLFIAESEFIAESSGVSMVMEFIAESSGVSGVQPIADRSDCSGVSSMQIVIEFIAAELSAQSSSRTLTLISNRGNLASLSP